MKSLKFRAVIIFLIITIGIIIPVPYALSPMLEINSASESASQNIETEENEKSGMRSGGSFSREQSFKDVQGGNWYDNFEDGYGIESKSNAIGMKDESIFITPKTAFFNITTTADFDSGIKSNVSTNSYVSSIPNGELQMTPIVVYSDSFDGPDEELLTDYNNDWMLVLNNGSVNIDEDESAEGSGSLRVKTTENNQYYNYTHAILGVNHSGVEFYQKFKHTNGSNYFSYMADSKEQRQETILINFIGASSASIRYYDGTTYFETGSVTNDTWYKWRVQYDFLTERYSAWLDGGAYSNTQIVNNLKLYNSLEESWAKYFQFISGTAWGNVTVTSWFDELKLYGFAGDATWESAEISLPEDTGLKNTVLGHYGLTSGGNIRKVQWLVDGNVKAEYNSEISGGLSTRIDESELTWGSFTDIDSDFTIRLYFYSNGARTPIVTFISGLFESNAGRIMSYPREIPEGYIWDKLTISGTDLPFGDLDVSILDKNNVTIPGFENITINSEINISNISAVDYPELKFFAELKKDLFLSSPVLSGWGVSWRAENAWRESFFIGSGIESSVDMDTSTGYAVFTNSGSVTTTTINIPNGSYYNALLVRTSAPIPTAFSLTLLDSSNAPIPGYQNLYDDKISLLDLDTQKYRPIKLRMKFDYGSAKGNLYYMSVNWTENSPPKIIDHIPSTYEVLRTGFVGISVNATDLEESEAELGVNLSYLAPSDSEPQTEYITKNGYLGNYWSFSFNPVKTAELGTYVFNVSCNDSFSFVYKEFEITVLNNIPTAPEVGISPAIPNENDTLVAVAFNSTDIETAADDIEYRYRWYRDGTYLPEFDNNTAIDAEFIDAGELWRCTAFAFDGDDLSEAGEAEVIIYHPSRFDSDGDGVVDAEDAFPMDIAASVDTDNDGSPDRWNDGMSEKNSTTGLHLDAFPTDPAASIDSDLDGHPDNWNPGKTKDDSTTDLVLDEYPDDPDRYKPVVEKPEPLLKRTIFLMIISLIIVLVLIVMAIILVLRTRRQRQKYGDKFDDKALMERMKRSEELIKDTEKEIVEGRTTSVAELAGADAQSKLEERKAAGEISDGLYEYLKNLVADSEEQFHGEKTQESGDLTK